MTTIWIVSILAKVEIIRPQLWCHLGIPSDLFDLPTNATRRTSYHLGIAIPLMMDWGKYFRFIDEDSQSGIVSRPHRPAFRAHF